MTTTVTPETERLLPTPRRRVILAAVAVGLAAVLVGLIGSWVPSAWGDEAATMSGAGRSPAELWRLVGNVDLVHGLYYAVVHAWFAVVPDTVMAARALSAVCIGLAAAGTVVIANRLSGWSTGVYAGLLVAALPRMTWAAGEARSSAVATALAVGGTLALVVALDRRRAGWWVLYGAAIAVGTALWMLLALLPLAHLVALWAWRRRARDLRAPAVASGAALVAVVPFLLAAVSQRGQVGWIPELGPSTVRRVVLDQYFGSVLWAAVPLALACGALAVVGVVRSLRAGDSRRRLLVLVALAWVVVPVVGVVAWSAIGSPLYVPKYLAFTTPGVAILVAVGIEAAFRTRTRTVAALCLVLLLAVPGWWDDRGPTTKDGSDWARVAAAVAGRAEPGDAVVFTDLHDEGGRVRVPGRAIAVAYPDAFAGLVEPTRVDTAAADGRLWDESRPVSAAGAALATVDTVWWVVDHRLELADPQRGDLEALGFRATDVLRFETADVVRFERGDEVAPSTG